MIGVEIHVHMIRNFWQQPFSLLELEFGQVEDRAEYWPPEHSKNVSSSGKKP